MDARWKTPAAGVVAGLLLFTPTPPISAETYQWIDKNGAVGFADSLGKVPPEYRQSAKKIEEASTGKNFQTMPGGSGSGPSYVPPAVSEPSQPPPPEFSPTQDPDYWRDRIRATQQQLDQLRTERQYAQEAYDNVMLQQFRGNRVDPEVGNQAAMRIGMLDQKIYEKEQELEKLADDARRAGIPASALNP